MPDCVVQEIPPSASSSSATSASPGFQFGRAGAVIAGTYLQVVAGVPSSVSGFIVPFSGTITTAFVTAEAASTFSIKVQKRTDPGPVYTDLTTITVTAARRTSSTLSVAVTSGDELCCLMFSGTCSNVQVGLIIEET